MNPAAAPLDWHRDGSDWPHRERSRFVDAGGLHWHVQHWEGPVPGAPRLLLLHGTGASTHSWRGLAPLLARHAEVLAVDLPGHAFTSPPSADGLTLPGMAALLGSLLPAAGFQPDAVVGHSAGAAIAVRMALDDLLPGLARIVAINGAFLPFGGPAAPVVSPLTRSLHAALAFSVENVSSTSDFAIVFAAPVRLIFAGEALAFKRVGEAQALCGGLRAGEPESNLHAVSRSSAAM